MSLTPAQRSMQARAAVHASWANTPDRTARTRPALQARLRRFADQVDPHGHMAPEDRERCARSAMRAHMTRLALKSSQARRLRGDGA